MKRYVAFIRAINVAGHASVRMSDLRDAFTAAGCKGVRIYIQSGNVVFDMPEGDIAAVFQKVRVRLCDLLGAEPGIFYRTVREVEGILRGAPFKRFETEPGIKLYVAFLFQKPRSKPRFPLLSSKEALEAIAMDSMAFRITSLRKNLGFRQPVETGRPSPKSLSSSEKSPMANCALELAGLVPDLSCLVVSRC